MGNRIYGCVAGEEGVSRGDAEARRGGGVMCHQLVIGLPGVWQAKQSFASKCVTKLEFGNEKHEK